MKGIRFLTLTVASFTLSVSIAVAQDTVTIKKSELEALVNELVNARIQQLGLEGEAFDEKVAKGIQSFVEKRQQAAQNKVHEKAVLARKVDPAKDYIYGEPDAPFTLIEYSDYECPFCKRFHKTPKELVDKYNGKVNWVYRHFPLGFHNPHATKQAEAAECAAELQGNDGFWKYGDQLYARTKSNKGFPIENLLPLAVELGFDEAKFSECFESERHAKKVQADMADGQKAGISGTPGNVLRHNSSNESRLLSGALGLDRIEKTLVELSEKTGESLQ